MAQADFFAPFSGATASWRFCSRAVSALRLPGTLAAGTHRKSNRPFTPAKQNAAKPPARRIFRRTFRPPGKIRLKPTKPDACRQAEPADRHPLKSAGRRPRPRQPSRPAAPATPAAFRRQPRSRACARAAAPPAGTGPQYGQVLYAASLRPQARVRFRAYSPIVWTGRRRHTRSAECRRQKCRAGFCAIRLRPRGAAQSG